MSGKLVKQEIQAAIEFLLVDGTFQDENVQKALEHLRSALGLVEGKTDHRRRLPDERQSFTHHFVIGSFDGYVTVGHYPEDGAPGEVFVKISKQGATLSGLLDAFAIMFSIALQYGAPLHVITDKLAGMRFDPSGFSPYPGIGYAKSLIDYLARWMSMRYLSPEEQPAIPPPPLVSELPPVPAPISPPKDPVVQSKPQESQHAVIGCDGPPCDRCGNIMQKMGSADCWICSNCGSTSGSCGS